MLNIANAQDFVKALRDMKWPNEDKIPDFVRIVFSRMLNELEFSTRRDGAPQIKFDHDGIVVTMALPNNEKVTNFAFSTVGTNNQSKCIGDWPSMYTLYGEDMSTRSEWNVNNETSRFTGPAIITEKNGEVKHEWYFLGKKSNKIEDDEQFYTWCESTGIDVNNLEQVDIGWIMMKWA